MKRTEVINVLIEKRTFWEMTNRIPFRDSHAVFVVSCKGTGEKFEDLPTNDFLTMVLQWRRVLMTQLSHIEAVYMCVVNNGNVWVSVPKTSVVRFREIVENVQLAVPNKKAGVYTTWNLLQTQDLLFFHKLIRQR